MNPEDTSGPVHAPSRERFTTTYLTLDLSRKSKSRAAPEMCCHPAVCVCQQMEPREEKEEKEEGGGEMEETGCGAQSECRDTQHGSPQETRRSCAV